MLTDLLPKLYDDIAHPALESIGKTIGNALEFILLPVNGGLVFLSDCAKKNLKIHLENYERKLRQVEENKRIEVHTQISVPILQKLEYISNNDIAEFFINLLLDASSIDLVKNAHPGFIDIISQLSSDEAKIIKYLKGKDFVAYSEVQAYVNDNSGYLTFCPRSTLICYEIKLQFPENILPYINNLERLGLLKDMSGTYKVDLKDYETIAEKNNFSQFNTFVPDKYSKITYSNSYYEITDFGKLFIKACCIE